MQPQSSLARVILAATLLLTPLAAAAQDDLPLLEDQTFKAAIEKIAPAVLRIETFGGLEKVGDLLVGTGPTTGLVVSDDGYILSSAFNFVQKPTSILVTLPSGKRAAAEIVARDDSRMLVLLKVDTDEPLLTPVAVGRDEMVVGQWTLAVGRTFSPTQVNMSVGLLSAKQRIWGKAIQTDAKVSPSNYGGPLIDIQGRVLGVLVPLSPQDTGEIAGAEWYDSGIGFAIPLAEINQQLDKLKRGQDLFAGVLGVALKGSDIYVDEALVAACPGNSPAGKAGIKPGDKVVELDGVIINRQAQLKHAIGPRYAGETVHVTVLRGDKRLPIDVELIDKLEPYDQPFFGILPRRDLANDQAVGGVVVRYVYPGSPAEQAGVQAGDRLSSLGGKPVGDASAAREIMATFEPRQAVAATFVHDGQAKTAEVKLTTLPTSIPPKLPPARTSDPGKSDQRPPVGLIEIKIPEEANECLGYVPENYHPAVPHGVVVWLHAPGGFDQNELIARWKIHCENSGLILLAPKATDPDKWQPTEASFVRKTLDDLVAHYNIDRSRIVLHGYQAGGTMSYLVAFMEPELIQGVAAVDAVLPGRVRPPGTDPLNRLAIYSAVAEKSSLKPRIEAGVKLLESAKYPVTVKNLGAAPRYLDADEIAELVRWLDALDRI